MSRSIAFTPKAERVLLRKRCLSLEGELVNPEYRNML